MSTGLFRLDAQLFAYLDLNYPIYVLMYFLAVVILSPIVEELLFRGIILRKLNTDYNFSIPFAILISSLLFGLCHSFGGILSAFVFGICMSVLYLKTKNILVPILAHTLNNLISFILAFTRIEYFILSNGIIVIIVLILFVITNFILFKHIFNEISNLN
ncbi:MAG: CPBP family intramembrane metalloprotease [archaeon]|nr:CPBP family intramembrane metalloprotease [archaeon]